MHPVKHHLNLTRLSSCVCAYDHALYPLQLQMRLWLEPVRVQEPVLVMMIVCCLQI